MPISHFSLFNVVTSSISNEDVLTKTIHIRSLSLRLSDILFSIGTGTGAEHWWDGMFIMFIHNSQTILHIFLDNNAASRQPKMLHNAPKLSITSICKLCTSKVLAFMYTLARQFFLLL